MEPELLEDVLKTAVRQVDRRARPPYLCDDERPDADGTDERRIDSAGHHQHCQQRHPIYAGRITDRSERGAEGDMVEVSISDDGPGIPDGAKKHLFDLFYTAGQGRADCQGAWVWA